MSRLRQAWYTFWYLTRWHHLARMLVILAFGLGLAGGGIYLLTRPYLSDTLDWWDIGELPGLIEGASPRYVAFAAEPDFSKKIYRTGVWFPYWGHCPPDRTYPLPPPGAPETEFRKLVGCRVTAKGSLNRNYVLRFTKDRMQDGKVVGREQVALAPLHATGERIWVRSETFRPGDPAEEEWLKRRDFSGVLTTHEQAASILPAGFIEKPASTALLPPGRFVMYSDTELLSQKELQQVSSHYWVPLKGGRLPVFIWATPDFEESFDGTITGVLEPRNRSDFETRNREYAQFSVVTQEALPARFGVIKYRTAMEYNDSEVRVGWAFITFGWLLVGAGVFGILVYIVAPRIIADAWERAFGSVRKQGAQ